MRTLTTLAAALFFALSGLTACAQEREPIVEIDTNKGKIRLQLFNETPQHRDNFLKLVAEKRYDGLLFHRVIKQFMIQAGDINSKDAPPDKQLGDGDLGYTVPAEFVYPKYFHRRGMLCAARMGDDVNPERASSASQFYIVTGKYYTESELKKMQVAQGVTFTPEQIQAYMLEGGAPHLDSRYTVFGKVIKGMKVVEKIEETPTGSADRPLKDVIIKSAKIIRR
ncbi:MAG: peptidylprolyl isomerase [Tannerellaceae bacterium]|jgi:peptidylprolyl isomerase/peptidyl-prolyl cis-trans isomerase B (cyclophilin B)|nr:peptidylprolyl isomerase [Tannerellaceae bacterium]